MPLRGQPSCSPLPLNGKLYYASVLIVLQSLRMTALSLWVRHMVEWLLLVSSYNIRQLHNIQELRTPRANLFANVARIGNRLRSHRRLASA